MQANSAGPDSDMKHRLQGFLDRLDEHLRDSKGNHLTYLELKQLRDLLRDLSGTLDNHEDAPVPADSHQPPRVSPFAAIDSPKMAQLEKLVSKAAASDLPVLIVGESGTGKELVAREIHRRSLRAHRPFLTENCAALTETLLESELFGHVRGSFTGAERDRKGILELAHQGTLFLDELGDMSLAMQSKLLRVLQEGEVRAVGSRQTTQTDIRFISATNRDLNRFVQQGRFRLDLLFRINVITIALPPLRDRREDIPRLVDYFLHSFTKRTGRNKKQFVEEALDLLCAYEWPGNIRELENTVQRCMVLCECNEITVRDLPDGVRQLEGLLDGRARARSSKTGEQILIEQALQDSLGDKAKAARYIGWSRPKLYRKIREYGISLEYAQPQKPIPNRTPD